MSPLILFIEDCSQMTFFSSSSSFYDDQSTDIPLSDFNEK